MRFRRVILPVVLVCMTSAWPLARGRDSRQQGPPQQPPPPGSSAAIPPPAPVETQKIGAGQGKRGPKLTAPAVLSRPSARFSLLFLQYRQADADAAVANLAKWTEGELMAEAVSSPTDDVWARAALATFLTEAGMRRGTFGLFSDYSPDSILLKDWGLDKNFEVASYRSQTIVKDLTRIAKKRNDDELLLFCGRWYAAATSYALRHANYAVKGLRDLADHDVGETGPVRLLMGSMYEPRIGPFMPTATVPCQRGMFMGPDGCVYDPTNRFSPPWTQEALYLLKHAVEADPTSVEGHLRLGRVLHLLNRNVDARPHLERAFHDAQAQEIGFLTYMSGLFLGDLLQHQGKYAEAVPILRAAVAVAPTAHIGNIALGEAMLKSGDTTGWDQVRHMFDDEDQAHPKATDPWFYYRYAQYWRLGTSLRELRQMTKVHQ